jgi:hypothetical protein
MRAPTGGYALCRQLRTGGAMYIGVGTLLLVVIILLLILLL